MFVISNLSNVPGARRVILECSRDFTAYLVQVRRVLEIVAILMAASSTNKFDEPSIFGVSSHRLTERSSPSSPFTVCVSAYRSHDPPLSSEIRIFSPARVTVAGVALTWLSLASDGWWDRVARDSREIWGMRSGRVHWRLRDRSRERASYSNTLSAASRIFTIRKDRRQSLTSISILCQEGFLSCGRAIR